MTPNPTEIEDAKAYVLGVYPFAYCLQQGVDHVEVRKGTNVNSIICEHRSEAKAWLGSAKVTKMNRKIGYARARDRVRGLAEVIASDANHLAAYVDTRSIEYLQQRRVCILEAVDELYNALLDMQLNRDEETT